MTIKENKMVERKQKHGHTMKSKKSYIKGEKRMTRTHMNNEREVKVDSQGKN